MPHALIARFIGQPARAGMGRAHGRFGLVLALLLMLAFPAGLAAAENATQPSDQPAATQPETAAPPVEQITTASITIARQAVRDADDLDKAVRDEAVASYDSAEAALVQANEHLAAAEAFQHVLQTGPERIQRLRAASTQPTSQPDLAIDPNNMALEHMEAQLGRFEAELADRQKKLAGLGEQLKLLAENRTKLPEWIAQGREQIKALGERLSAIPQADQPVQLAQARRDQLLAQRRLASAALLRHEAQLASNEIRSRLLRAEQDVLGREVADYQAAVVAWRQRVSKLRDEQAQQQVELARQAERDAADQHDLVLTERRENTRLAAMRTGPDGLSARQRQTAARLADVTAQASALDEAFAKVREMVDTVGLTDAIGLLLRRERSAMPDARAYRQANAERQPEISRVRLMQFELREQAERLGNIESRAQQLVEQIGPSLSEARRDDLLAAVRHALSDRRQLLAPLIDEHEQYFNTLIELDRAERELANRAAAFAAYIDERLLWVRNVPPLGGGDIARSWDSLLWLASAGNWMQVVATLAYDALANPVTASAGLLLLAMLVLLRRRMVATLTGMDVSADATLAETMIKLLSALLLSTFLGTILPLAMWFPGWRLSSSPQASDFAFFVGQGLMAAALAWWPVSVFQQICREHGLAERQFRWSITVLRPMRASLRRLTVVALPLVFLVGLATSAGEVHRNSLGRLALMLALLLLAAYSARFLAPVGPVMGKTIGRTKDGWLYRLRLIWYPLIVVMPVGLAAAAAGGYHYAAMELAGLLLVQLHIVLMLVVLRAMLLRLILVGRRRLAVIAAGQRRQAEQERRQAQDRGEPSEAAVEPASQLDLSAVNAQTQRFVNYLIAALAIGMMLAVWAGVLPALGQLRQIYLWGEIALADLLAAMLVVAATVVLARNIGGVLEITLLSRLPVDAGARFAVNALTRYAIWVAGAIISFHMIGVQWLHVQWLVAAMTVGLGFGLQEIFANFVSGLIILFERPIRVGDVVTVGDVSGTVTRIRIRATTIMDWDRKELIVPNKRFITGELVNWTLSDTVMRVVLPVGIAYGSDTALARSLLLQVARDHERVLDEPEPSALFMGFGNSVLNFELRVFVCCLKDMLPVRHDLLSGIDAAFREAGIEIAFPQQDIHIRSIRAALPLPQAGEAVPKPAVSKGPGKPSPRPD